MTGIIVIDGCDCTGKTTLAQAICDEVGEDKSKYMHLSFDPTWDMWRYQTDALINAIALSDIKTVVVDRLWPSENIYADTYRDGVGIGIATRMMHRMLLRFGAIYVIAAPPTEMVVANHRELKKSRDEMYADVSEVSDRFLNLVHGSVTRPNTGSYAEQLAALGGVITDTHWFQYDIAKHPKKDIKSCVKGLLSCLEIVRDGLTYQPGLNPNWGNLAGRVGNRSTLLVGDVSGKKHILNWPFYENGGCSLYLTKALHAAYIPEEEMCLMNANDPGTTAEQLKEVADNCKKVIALGANASSKLHDLHIFHEKIRHPQHARRFDHSDVSTYAEELKDALSN